MRDHPEEIFQYSEICGVMTEWAGRLALVGLMGYFWWHPIRIATMAGANWPSFMVAVALAFAATRTIMLELFATSTPRRELLRATDHLFDMVNINFNMAIDGIKVAKRVQELEKENAALQKRLAQYEQ